MREKCVDTVTPSLPPSCTVGTPHIWQRRQEDEGVSLPHQHNHNSHEESYYHHPISCRLGRKEIVMLGELGA